MSYQSEENTNKQQEKQINSQQTNQKQEQQQQQEQDNLPELKMDQVEKLIQMKLRVFEREYEQCKKYDNIKKDEKIEFKGHFENKNLDGFQFEDFDKIPFDWENPDYLQNQDNIKRDTKNLNTEQNSKQVQIENQKIDDNLMQNLNQQFQQLNPQYGNKTDQNMNQNPEKLVQQKNKEENEKKEDEGEDENEKEEEDYGEYQGYQQLDSDNEKEPEQNENQEQSNQNLNENESETQTQTEHISLKDYKIDSEKIKSYMKNIQLKEPEWMKNDQLLKQKVSSLFNKN